MGPVVRITEEIVDFVGSARPRQVLAEILLFCLQDCCFPLQTVGYAVLS